MPVNFNNFLIQVVAMMISAVTMANAYHCHFIVMVCLTAMTEVMKRIAVKSHQLWPQYKVTLLYELQHVYLIALDSGIT